LQPDGASNLSVPLCGIATDRAFPAAVAEFVRPSSTMNRFERKFIKLALIQAGISAVALSIWFFVTARAYLAASPDGDLYAHTWSFQALNFCMFYLPPYIFILCALFLIERAVLRRLGQRTMDHETQSLG
jgi:hypothetical protein